MINKNFYRKTNDKKILHKVGKQWKVVSVALLMAIGGTAVATHVNASANTNAAGATPYEANQAYFNNKPASAKPKQQSSAAASVEYYPNASGSAAMYFDKTASDNAVAAKQYNTVNSYVQSLNNEYNPQVNSYSAKSASYSSNATKDSKLAASYKATNDKPQTTTTVNSLAAQHHMPAQLYQNMVQAQEQYYSGAVKNASGNVKAASDVTSLVNSLEGADLNSASMSASAADYVAKSNYIGAEDVLSSVNALSNGNDGGILNAAKQLSYGAQQLNAEGNATGYSAALNEVASVANINVNDTDYASLSNSFSSAVTAKVSSASQSMSDAISAGETGIEQFADNTNYVTNYNGVLVNTTTITAPTWMPSFLNTTSETSAYRSAVSAAVDINFAGSVASLSTSLYGKYAPQAAGYANEASEFSEMQSSASVAVRSASNALNVANANWGVINDLDYDVNSMSDAHFSNGNEEAEAKASVANSLLAGGVNKFEQRIGYLTHGGIYSQAADGSWTAYDFGPKITKFGNYSNNAKDYFAAAVYNNVKSNDSNRTIAENVLGNTTDSNVIPSTNRGNQSSVYSALSSAASVLNSVANSAAGRMAGNAEASGSHNGKTLVTSNVSGKTEYELNSNSSVSSLDSVLASGNTNAAYSLLSDASLTFNADGISSADGADGSYVTTGKTSVTTDQVASQINSVANVLNSMANAANNMSATAKSGSDHNELSASNGLSGVAENANWTENNDVFDNTPDKGDFIQAALLSDGVDLDALHDEASNIANVYNAENSIANSSADMKNDSDYADRFNNALSAAASSANSALTSAQNSSASNSASNDDDVTLASYFANSYSNEGNANSASASSESVALNNFFKDMTGNDPVFTKADDAYSHAEAAAHNDKKMGVLNAKIVYNNAPHFLDALKGAKLHSDYNFGSANDKIVGSVNKGDRLAVLDVNFNRNGLKHGATRYIVKDVNNGKTGFFTGQPQYSKAAYLNATSADAGVSVKTLKPVTVYNNINGGKAVKTLKAGTVVNGVNVVRDNPDNDAMGFTKVETAAPEDYFFTANTDYVEVLKNQPVNNQPSNYGFNLSNVSLAKGYNNNSQY